MTVDAVTAAVAVGVTTRTIQRWVADGVITNHGSPKQIRVHLSDLEYAKTRRALQRLLPT